MNKVVVIIFLPCLMSTILTAQAPRSTYDPAPRSSYDPAPRNAPRLQRDSFIEFTLKRINPGDTDYGRQIEEDRRAFMIATLENLDWWVMVTSVVMLVVLFLNWVRMDRERNRREIVAARFLTWYHNELIASRQTALDAIEKHRQLQQVIDKPEAKPAPKALAAQAGSFEVRSAAAQPGAPSGWQSSSSPDVQTLQTELNTSRQTINAQQEQIVRLQHQLHGQRQNKGARKGDETAPSTAERN